VADWFGELFAVDADRAEIADGVFAGAGAADDFEDVVARTEQAELAVDAVARLEQVDGFAAGGDESGARARRAVGAEEELAAGWGGSRARPRRRAVTDRSGSRWTRA
jgi:hypothetical protein